MHIHASSLNHFVLDYIDIDKHLVWNGFGHTVIEGTVVLCESGSYDCIEDRFAKVFLAKNCVYLIHQSFTTPKFCAMQYIIAN